MSPSPLRSLKVIAVRYRGSQRALRDERSLDAYNFSGVYSAAGVPYELFEPRFPEHLREAKEPENLGTLGGLIAEAVKEGLNANSGILLTGGDCTHITGVVGGLQNAFGLSCRIGLVWFDAHGDFNTPKTTISGMLGGMPVAVCASLAFPIWRERSHIKAPLPTDRILMVDVRNLDPAEAQLINATGITIAAPAQGFPGQNMDESVRVFANQCDVIYLHIDSDILDERFVPNHGTREPNGPDISQVAAAIETIFSTGKVAAMAVVSVYGEGAGSEISKASGIALIEAGLKSWRKHGMASF